MKTNLIKIIFYICGLVIISLGVTMTIKADLGVGAWDAMNVGLTESVGFTVGNWVMIIGACLILSNALIAKERPDLLAGLTILIIGKMIDFWMLVVLDDLILTSLAWQLPFLLIGIIAIAFGVSLYLQPQYSLNPVDGFMVALQKRFGLNVTVAKTLTELFALCAALFLGGPIGFGTVIILVSIGPAIQFFDEKAKRAMHKMIS